MMSELERADSGRIAVLADLTLDLVDREGYTLEELVIVCVLLRKYLEEEFGIVVVGFPKPSEN